MSFSSTQTAIKSDQTYEHLAKGVLERSSMIEISWTLPDFRSLLLEKSTIESEKFGHGFSRSKAFRLIMKFKDDEEVFHVELHRIMQSKLSPCDTIEVLFSLQSSSRRFNSFSGNCFHRSAILDDVDNFITVEFNAKHSDFKPFLIDNHSLAVICRMDSCHGERTKYERMSDDIIENFEFLLETKRFWDLVLQAEDRTFRVHRAILSARSPVFCAMLEGDTLEKQQGMVSIVDFGGEVVEELLRYIYTSNVRDLNSKLLLQLYEAADKYALPDLQRKCSEILHRHLSVDEVVEVLVKADAHQDTKLLKCAELYIIDNIQEIIKREEWMSLLRNRPELANAVFIRYADLCD